jgi:hypothetical protein
MVSQLLDQDSIWNGNVEPLDHTKGKKVVNSGVDHSDEKESETGKFSRRLKPQNHELLSTIRSEEEQEIPSIIYLE